MGNNIDIHECAHLKYKKKSDEIDNVIEVQVCAILGSRLPTHQNEYQLVYYHARRRSQTLFIQNVSATIL